jgi:hypothetical protein
MPKYWKIVLELLLIIINKLIADLDPPTNGPNPT